MQGLHTSTLQRAFWKGNSFVPFQKIKNPSFTIKRNQLNASSVPDTEKASLPETLSFIPKYGCRENPGVFLRGRGPLQKKSLSGALHSLCRGSSRDRAKSKCIFRSPQTLAEASVLLYTVEAYCPPACACRSTVTTVTEQDVEGRSLGLPSCQLRYS